MKTRLNVKMALVLLGVMVFSGCGVKNEVYIPIKCEIEKPIKMAFDYSCSSKFPTDDFKYLECVSEKIELLSGDYKKLETAFDACKN